MAVAIEETALLKAIRKHPRDDTYKMIYADWLDEQGRAESAQAIRMLWGAYLEKPVAEYTFRIRPWDVTVANPDGQHLHVTTCKDGLDVLTSFKAGSRMRFRVDPLYTGPPRATAQRNHLAGLIWLHEKELVGSLITVFYQRNVRCLIQRIVPLARVRRIILYALHRRVRGLSSCIMEVEYPEPFRPLTEQERLAYQEEHHKATLPPASQ